MPFPESSSLTNDVTDTQAAPDAVDQSGTQDSGSTDAGGKQPAQTQTVQEAIDYMKDHRLKTMWSGKDGKFDPNLMYKSIRSGDELIEKQYKPLKSQVDTVTKMFSEYGIEPTNENIKAALDELKSFRDPENPTVKRGNYLSFFLDDPEFKNDTEQFLEGLRKKAIQREFGEGVSDSIVKEIMENREYRKEQERKEKARQEEEQHNTRVKNILSGWGEVEKMCKDQGFAATQEMRDKVFDHCVKNGMQPSIESVYYSFMKLYGNDLNNHNRAKVQSELIKQQTKTRKSGIIPAASTRTTPAQTDGKKPGLFERVMGRLNQSQT